MNCEIAHSIFPLTYTDLLKVFFYFKMVMNKKNLQHTKHVTNVIKIERDV